MGNSSSSPSSQQSTPVATVGSMPSATVPGNINKKPTANNIPDPTNPSIIVRLSNFLQAEQYVFMYGQDLETREKKDAEIKKMYLAAREEAEKNNTKLPPPPKFCDEDDYNLWLCQVKEKKDVGGSVDELKIFCSGNLSDEKYFGSIDFDMNLDYGEKYQIRPMTEADVQRQIAFNKKIGEFLVSKTSEKDKEQGAKLKKVLDTKLVRDHFPPSLLYQRGTDDVNPFMGSGLFPVYDENDQMRVEGFSMTTMFADHYKREMKKFEAEGK